ncbi:MAG: nicotinamide riboside transporter PnuC [Catalinimonas sp.]
MNWLELTAAVLSLLCVWLGVRQHSGTWPLAMLGAALYAVVFFRARLYADAGLQCAYFALSLYGWYAWRFGTRGATDSTVLRPVRLPRAWVLPLVVLAAVGTALLGWSLARYSDTDVPYVDAGTTVVSLIAQYLLSRKYVENWLVWIGVDAVATGVYVYKGLWFTCGLYAVLIVLAWHGYRTWERDRRVVAA